MVAGRCRLARCLSPACSRHRAAQKLFFHDELPPSALVQPEVAAQPLVPSPAPRSCQASNALKREHLFAVILMTVPVLGRQHEDVHRLVKLSPNPKPPVGPLVGMQCGQSHARVPAHLTIWHHGHGHGMSDQPEIRAQQIDQEILSFQKPLPACCLLGICCRDQGGRSHLPFLIISNHRVAK